jgi:hypothetical protein
MDKFEVEELDGGNPPVDGWAGLDVGVSEHATHVLCIHFYYKIGNTDKLPLERMQCPKQTVEFDPRLRVAALVLVPSNESEAEGLRVIRNVSFICAFVPEDNDFQHHDEDLFGRDGGSAALAWPSRWKTRWTSFTGRCSQMNLRMPGLPCMVSYPPSGGS